MSGLGLTHYPAIDLWQIALDGTVVAENLIGRSTGVDILSYKGLGLPEQRTADVDLVSEHGVVALGDYHKARVITVEIGIHGQGACVEDRRADAWTQLRRLAGVWQARTKDVVLELCMTDGTTYALVGRPRKFADDLTGLRFGGIKVAAEFVATDPGLYDLMTSSLTLRYDPTASGTFTLTDTPNAGGAAPVLSLNNTPDGGGPGAVLTLAARVAGLGTIYHLGNTATWPITTLFGPVTNPTIQNLTTGQTLSFLTGFAAGHTLVIDHKARSIVLDGLPRPDLIGPGAGFWPLVRDRNDLSLRQTGNGVFTATVLWRTRWL